MRPYTLDTTIKGVVVSWMDAANYVTCFDHAREPWPLGNL